MTTTAIAFHVTGINAEERRAYRLFRRFGLSRRDTNLVVLGRWTTGRLAGEIKVRRVRSTP